MWGQPFRAAAGLLPGDLARKAFPTLRFFAGIFVCLLNPLIAALALE